MSSHIWKPDETGGNPYTCQRCNLVWYNGRSVDTWRLGDRRGGSLLTPHCSGGTFPACPPTDADFVSEEEAARLNDADQFPGLRYTGTFDYTNKAGLVERRHVEPIRLTFGTTPAHPVRTLLFLAWDLDLRAYRTFAVSSMSNWVDDPRDD